MSDSENSNKYLDADGETRPFGFAGFNPKRSAMMDDETELRELRELRDWMDKYIWGLRNDRSTASYALEFLKTGRRNLELCHSRTMLSIMLSDAREIFERVPKAQELCLELEKNQSVIPWKTDTEKKG